jgi:hypothetical protein
VRQTSEVLDAGVTAYELDDDTVLFLENTGELLRLNPTAALIWRGLSSGLSSVEICDLMAQVFGAPALEVGRDVQALITSLQRAGALDGSPINKGPTQSIEQFPRPPRHLPNVSSPKVGSRGRSYGLVDFRFRLSTPTAFETDVDRLLGHLSATENGSPEVFLDILHDGTHWVLLRDGRAVDSCTAAVGVIPMLHSNILLMAYAESKSMAGIHAAAVTRGDSCILMPATSGSGKSTLAAALLTEGFGYCTDDLALLTDEPVRIRPVPTCLGLKSGSWNVLENMCPEIRQLPTHVRADGKRIRYLPPPPSGDVGRVDNYKVCAIVFPLWSQGTRPAQIRKISSAEGLSRLTTAGYDLHRRMNQETVECLIRWISGLPCLELRYDRPPDAAPLISALIPKC